ncbi:MAG: VOC family protein [Dehalococcoidia bacterium]
MPNPVVHFEIRGADAERTKRFYREAFGWELFDLGGGFALVETESHTHDEAGGGTTYTGEDAYMNEGVTLSEDGGVPVWRYAGEPAEAKRYFSAGIGGGIGSAEAGRGASVSISIQVPDLDAALRRIESLGGQTTSAPREVVPGVFVAEFADLDGNHIGLVRAPQYG